MSDHYVNCRSRADLARPQLPKGFGKIITVFRKKFLFGFRAIG